jgi:hypothetical protein
MTPFEIDILLHYHTRGGDFRDGDFDAPIVRPTLEWLASAGLLRRSEKLGQMYEGTDATAVFVEALCNVPAPELRWVMPTSGG